MSTRRIGRLPQGGRRQPCPLSTDDVYAIVAERADTKLLSTSEITEWCQVQHPDYPGVTTQVVRQRLNWIERRGRIHSLSGSFDTDQLRELGVAEPDVRQRYWTLRRTTT